MKKCSTCIFLTKKPPEKGSDKERFFCGHPNRMQIRRYLKDKGSKREPGFIANGTEGVPNIKTSPMFCPFRGN